MNSHAYRGRDKDDWTMRGGAEGGGGMEEEWKEREEGLLDSDTTCTCKIPTVP